LLRPNKSIFFETTSSGKLDVEVAKYLAPYAKWNGEWAVLESFQVSSGKLFQWKSNSPLGTCRIKFTPDTSDAKTNAWTHLSA
jgi:hypothetical protein